MAIPLPQPRTVEVLPPATTLWLKGNERGRARLLREARGKGPGLRPLPGPGPGPGRPAPTGAAAAAVAASATGLGPLARALPEPCPGAPARRRGAGDEFDRHLTQLMVRFQGSREAQDFEALYAAGAEDVLHWIRSLLRQGGAQLDASELLQDTFVNVYRYPSGFRPEHAGSFRVWVRTIAGNAVRRARRRAAPRASALEEQLSEPCDPGASPLQQAYGREQALVFARSLRLLYAATLSAFERLRPRDRRALELVELEGQPYAEAGPRLGVPPENMKMIVFRARRRLLLEIGAALRCDRS